MRTRRPIMLQESGQLVFDERVDGENRQGRNREGKRGTTLGPVYSHPWVNVFPSLFVALTTRSFPSSRGGGTKREPPMPSKGGTSSSRHRRSQHIRRRVSLITDRPLFINGELVSTFTYARIPAITHRHHARAGVSAESPGGALPATSPRNASQGHRRIAQRNRCRIDSRKIGPRKIRPDASKRSADLVKFLQGKRPVLKKNALSFGKDALRV